MPAEKHENELGSPLTPNRIKEEVDKIYKDD